MARRRSRMRWCSAPSTRSHGIARLQVALDRPVIGLGASAPLHYAGLPALVGNSCMVPEDTDVANALGAVVGQVRVSAEARSASPRRGFSAVWPAAMSGDFRSEEEAIAAAGGQRCDTGSPARARQAGTDTAEIDVSQMISTSDGRGPAHVHRGACRARSPPAGRELPRVSFARSRPR